MKILCCTYTPVVTGNMEMEFGCKSMKKSGLIVNPRFSSFYEKQSKEHINCTHLVKTLENARYVLIKKKKRQKTISSGTR